MAFMIFFYANFAYDNSVCLMYDNDTYGKRFLKVKSIKSRIPEILLPASPARRPARRPKPRNSTRLKLFLRATANEKIKEGPV
jgi:hypothetical protein